MIGIPSVFLSAVTWPSVVTAAAASVGLLYATLQVAIARRHQRQTLAYNYFARFNDSELLPYLARTISFLNVGTASRQELRWKRWKAMTLEEQLELAYPLNLLEELAGLYNDGLVDRAIVKKTLGKTSAVLWGLAYPWFVERSRDDEAKHEPDQPEEWVIYVQWEQMQADLGA